MLTANPINTSRALLFSILFTGCVGTNYLSAAADEKAEPAIGKSILLRSGLVIPPVGKYGRSVVHTDAIEAAIVAGKWTAPQAGDEVKLPDGSTRKWEPITAAASSIITRSSSDGTAK